MDVMSVVFGGLRPVSGCFGDNPYFFQSTRVGWKRVSPWVKRLQMLPRKKLFFDLVCFTTVASLPPGVFRYFRWYLSTSR